MMSAAQICAASRADTPIWKTVVDAAYGDEDRGRDQQSPSAPWFCTAVIAATRMPMNIAMPPMSGISPICCLRPAGLVRDAKTKRERTQRERENHCYCKRQRSRQR